MHPKHKKTLRRRITLIFSAAAIIIALSSLALLYFVSSGPRQLGNFHVPSLYAAQKMNSHVEEAMERTFAYLVSGDPAIRDEVEEELEEYRANLNDWNALHEADPARDESRAALVGRIAQNVRLLETNGRKLFREYEESGRSGLSTSSFEAYQAVIDETMQAFGSLISLEKAVVDSAHGRAESVIQSAAVGIVIIAILAILLSMAAGRLIARTVSQPVELLARNARSLAEGDLESPFDMSGAGEIADLSASLESMRVALKGTFNRLRVLLEQMPTILWTTDKNLTVDTLEGAGLESLGHGDHPPLDRPVAALFDPSEYALVSTSHRKALKGRSVNFETRHEDRVFTNYLEPLRDSHDDIIGTIGVAIDISESRKAAATIDYMANHDRLTDLPNRTLFQDRLTHDLGHAQRRGDALALFFVDIDGFKHINDTLGSSVGDGLLRRIAARLTECVREDDTLARIGGDEFAAIQSDIGSADDAAALAQRMLDEVSAHPIELEGHELEVTCSIGVVMAEQGSLLDTQSMMARADIAMHQSKKGGPGRYQFFDAEMNRQVHDRINLERELREALNAGQLYLEYQPVVDLSTGRACRFECLVRWQHPVRGVISPEDFIPLAESSGLIVPLGEWVLEEACALNRRLQDAGIPPVKAAVNVSAVQLQMDGFPDCVSRILMKTGLSAEHLEIELTESTLISDTRSASLALDRLSVLGVTLSIDDFGTGYSSMGYLRQLSVDTLKIDRSFVMDVETDEGAAAIVKATIGLAANLGLRSVAEGVETAGQLKFLIEHGCDEVQGFYFNEPLSEELLREGLAQIFQV